MIKKIILIVFCLSLTMFMACPSGSNTETNNVKTETNTTKMPEGMDTKPIQPDGKTTPGIPDPKTVHTNEIPKGTTPTPGIPDPKTIGKTPVPKGATPTPGIPSPEELKKQRERKIDPNDVNKAPTKSADETTSPIDRKRKVNNRP